MKLLNEINNIQDLKKLNYKEKEKLANEIREYMIETISKTGGHLASNLGVVELTIALHSVLNVPEDKIIWDVGHQTYVHKILTGRREELKTIRTQGGIAGFPKISESEMDCFNTGHSSTSISVALGMAKSRDIKKEHSNIIAVIGDGALTGGMALEALNDAGNSKTNITVILNDNEMSISKNVGGISMALSKIRTRKFYTTSSNYLKIAIKKIPKIGNKIVHFVRKVKYSIKQLVIHNMFFEDLGFVYLGPVDGHDIEKMESLIKISNNINGPVLIHVVTKKGKGYKPAEDNPDRFHAIGQFDIETGNNIKNKPEDYSKRFGKKMVQLAEKNEKVVAITAAMKDGTGLTEFATRFKDRFFDVGIAEQHALGFAAGMAATGLIPIVSIYSSFYQRAYDQVIHDICISKMPVIMCVDRAGIVGNDGETHQGILDMAFFRLVPNLTIMAPKDFTELEQMLDFAVELNAPVVIRYPRGGEGKTEFKLHEKIKLGCSEILNRGADITIITIGKMVDYGMQITEILEADGIKVDLFNARFIKPFDMSEEIIESIRKTRKVITIEDGIIDGGLATIVKEKIIEKNLNDIKIKCFGYPDKFIKHGSVEQIEERYGISVSKIIESIKMNFLY